MLENFDYLLLCNGTLIIFFILIATVLVFRREKLLMNKHNSILQNEIDNTQKYFDIAGTMILVLDNDHRVIKINRRGCEIMGYRADEMIGKNWIENFLPLRYRTKVMEVSSDVKKESNSYSEFTNPVLTKEGTEKVIFWRNTTLKDENGLVIGIVTSGEDITERINSEKLIQESELFYRTVFATVDEAIFILEENFVIDCNAKALTLLKMSKEDIIGNHIQNSIRRFECPGHSFDEYLTQASEGVASIVRCSLLLSGEINENKIIEVTINTLGTQQKNRILLSVRDMTQHLEQESKLLANMRQAQMGEMISNIAHQWRQPLTIISSIVSQIRLQEHRKKESDASLIEKSMDMEKQIQYLSQTITDFRDFFNPNKSKEYVIISKILGNALNLLDHVIKSHGIIVEYVIRHDSEVFLVQNEILQVIIVLLKNSLDAFVENEIKSGQIMIIIDRLDAHAIITIQDNAGGIPPNIINNIFLPYYTTKTQSIGTGIGLSLSKTIIEDYCNGSIEAESENGCTTFTIKLPLEEAKL